MTRTRYDGEGPSVTVERLEGLGHQWPGSPIDLGPDFGPPAPHYDASARILAFFDGASSPTD